MPAVSPYPPPELFHHTVRVYWEDTDAGGVVFYANYLKYFERARTEWLRSLGLGQQVLRDRAGVMFVVTDARTGYRAPARLDDLIDISVRLAARSAVTMTLAQEARRGATLLAEGEIRIACVDAETFVPCRIPIEVMQTIS
jgi:acyl-CoA thioester hydrolase